MDINFYKSKIINISLVIFFLFLLNYFWKFFALYPLSFMADDSYYYSQIAYNIGVNRFSSFDGLNLTTGYHLLWTAVLSFISFFMSFFTQIKEVHLMSHISIYFLIMIFFLKKFSSNTFETLILSGIIISGYILMENLIVILLLFLIYKELIKFNKKNQFSKILLFSFFLIPLARIDAIILVGFIPLILFLNTRNKFYLLLLLSLLIGIIFNFIIYYIIGGEIYSVSSYVKMNQNITNTMEHRIIKNVFYTNIMPLGWLTAKVRGYILILFFLVFLINIIILKKKQSLIFYGFFSGLYFYFFTQLFLNYIDTWYYSIMFGFLFILLKLFNYESQFNNIPKFIFYIFIIFLLFGKFYNSFKYYDFRNNYFLEIKQISNYLPENSKIYQYDISGHLGFFSRTKVINGDGLVNSFKYADDLLNKNLSNYLIQNNICYLTDLFTQKLENEKVILNQSGLIVKYSDVFLKKKFKSFNLFELLSCKNN